MCLPFRPWCSAGAIEHDIPAVPAKPRTSLPLADWLLPRSSVNPGTRWAMSSAVHRAHIGQRMPHHSRCARAAIRRHGAGLAGAGAAGRALRRCRRPQKARDGQRDRGEKDRQYSTLSVPWGGTGLTVTGHDRPAIGFDRSADGSTDRLLRLQRGEGTNARTRRPPKLCLNVRPTRTWLLRCR